MKKTIKAIIIILILTTIISTLAACDFDNKGKTAWVESLSKASESTSATVKRTVKDGDILLSESITTYTKNESGWSFVQNDKTLSQDPFANEKYQTSTTNGTVQNAPLFSLDKNIIEDFTVKVEDNVSKYHVSIYADKLKGFLSLSDADYSRISDFDFEIDVIGDKVSEINLEYKIDGSEVSLEISYAY